MKKKDFVTLVMSVIGGLLFGLGMCMGLVPEMGDRNSSIAVGLLGLIVLLAMIIVRRKMDGKPAVTFNGRAIGFTLFGIAGSLILGLGMCMAMLWNMMAQGIAVGVAGIIILICLIPMTKGLEE